MTLAVALVIWPSGYRLAGIAAGVPACARRRFRDGRSGYARVVGSRSSNAARSALSGWGAPMPAIWKRRTSALVGVAGVVAYGTFVVRILPWQLTISSLLVSFTVASLVRHARCSARARADLTGLVMALRAIVRELNAGAGQQEAVTRVLTSAAPAARGVLELLDQQRWNSDPSPSNALLRDAAAPDSVAALPKAVVSRIYQAWMASAAHGVPLAAVVTACISDLEDRAAVVRLRSQHVAGPAASGYVLSALPIAGIAMGAGMGSRPIDVLLGGTLGGLLLVVGAGLCCAGLLWTSRIVRGSGDD
ncbi:MAG: hypothetical protein ABI382_05160 [Nakamurella sp.]